jgi:hypothetical protein
MASHIGRRRFLATLGGAAATRPLASRAPERIRHIAVLMGAGSALPTVSTTPTQKCQHIAHLTTPQGDFWILK